MPGEGNVRAIILGIGSDIGKDIAARLIAEGWEVHGTVRRSCDFSSNESIDKAVSLIAMPWDLLICAVGDLVPIGKFSAVHPDDWTRSVQVNALGPLRMLHHLLPHRRENATAVFFAGTNPGKTNPLYSAYSSAKAMLTRAVQEIDAELKGCKAFVIAPGFVKTKIHAVHDVSDRQDFTPYEDIYACLVNCMGRSKADVGGKRIYVPDWAMVWKQLA